MQGGKARGEGNREGGMQLALWTVLVVLLQESYNLLQKHQIQVSHEDIERVDTIRYMWAKLQEQVAHLQTTLLKIQPRFRHILLTDVELYRTEVGSYTKDYGNVSVKSVTLS